jgi:predicted anti-sigma-YlaC factor YlaD
MLGGKAVKWRRLSRVWALIGLALLLGGCSIRGMAVRALGSALASSGDVFASDEDPELVSQALPFALKTIEALLAEAPEDRNLLLAACSGFTQYAYAFVEVEAFLVEIDDYRRSRELDRRALKLYLRARDYCLRGLETRHAGIGGRLRLEPVAAVVELDEVEIGFIVWTGAAWGSAISLALDQPAIAADVPAVRALLERAERLDADYGNGLVHAALISLDALPETMGGSVAGARAHFDRAVELTAGASAGPYVSLAVGVSVPAQDSAEFRHLLEQALAVDPDAVPAMRLENLIAQRQARVLLDRIEEYFIEVEPVEE